MVVRLPAHKETPIELLRAAAALWVANILVFASWYWHLDGGGPNERDKQGVHTDGAFLFPQMMMDPERRREMGEDTWSPGFVDYLFLALQYEYGVLTDRRARAVAMGESDDDCAVADFAGDGGAAGGAGRQYSLDRFPRPVKSIT